MNLKKNFDAIRFGLFLSMMTALYKGVLCSMRRYSSDDKKNSAIAGFLSAFAILIDPKERRKFIGLMILGRSLVNYINHS